MHDDGPHEPIERAVAVSEELMRRLQQSRIPIGVTPGELFDRLTILWVKRDKIQDEEKLKLIAAELEVFKKALCGEGEDCSMAWLISSLPFTDKVSSLYRINSRLWAIEDTIRELDATVFPLDLDPSASREPDEEEEYRETIARFVTCARSVYVMNDARAKAKEDINRACGQAGEPKQYREYSNE